MKKLLTIALFALSITTSAFANNTASVAKSVTNSFKANYKNATDVSWVATDNYSKASFMMDGKKMEAFYDIKGEVIGTSAAITQDELPASAKKALASKFAGYTMKEAISFQGIEENASYISLESEKESLILKADQSGTVSIFKRTKK
jgi:hypothetical protein